MTNSHFLTRSFKRRRFLQGVGVCLGLPLLDCFRPLYGDSIPAGETPQRMLLISNNLGVLPAPFFPQQSGADYQLSPYLKVIGDHRQDFTVFSGLSHPSVVGGHSTENCFLTAARDPTRSGFRNSISLDQFAVEQLGQQTRFPTLNLGVNIDKANRSLSWSRDGALLPAEDSPAALFRQMFVQGSKSEVELRLHQLQQRSSILDVLLEDMRHFQRGLGTDDQHRLDQYFTSVRQLEERLHAAGNWEQLPKPVVEREPPVDILDKSQFFSKLELMLSMAQLALQSDSTRIVTLMIDAFATGVFEIVDQEKSLDGYHNLSHHGQSPQKVAQLEKVDLQQLRIFGELLESLAAQPDGAGRLLDSTMVLFGSNMGDANIHSNTNLPILLAGGGFQHGEHLAFRQDDNTPLCNLFVSMLQRMGVETDRFSSSTGTLTGLMPTSS
ncbi:DUF1552 domain-containing protein [Blastopirellula sp. J2-11]|uniref:DUF1552 domain-containing protein n=1 Tax=Blastopirellula sp. J2-11 TaxID=2943192 RepID=UPI0021C5D65A|nr:DUF1552 domain-containing protein [Blastopirellula sp. J2-11]UUO07575.1 DUF1552 domain-containing protein [Blastopirellula sp. J2-11]